MNEQSQYNSLSRVRIKKVWGNSHYYQILYHYIFFMTVSYACSLHPYIQMNTSRLNIEAGDQVLKIDGLSYEE